MTQSPGIDANTFKSLSRRLHRQLSQRDPVAPLTLSVLQEEIARALGHKNLHAAQAAFNNPRAPNNRVVPAPLQDPKVLESAAASEVASFEHSRSANIHRAAPELVDLFAHAYDVIEQTRDQVLAADHPFRAWAQEHRFDLARMADNHYSHDFRSHYNLLAWAVMANSGVAEVLRELGDELSWRDVESTFKTITGHSLGGFRHHDVKLTDENRIRVERLVLGVRPKDMAHTFGDCVGLLSEDAAQQAFDASLALLVKERDVENFGKTEGPAGALIWGLASDSPNGRRTRGTTLFKTLLPEEVTRPKELVGVLAKWVEEGDVGSFEAIERVLVDHHPQVAALIPGDGETQRLWMEASLGLPPMFRRMCVGAQETDKEDMLARCLAHGMMENAQWLMTHGTRLTSAKVVCDGLTQALRRYHQAGLDGVLAALERIEMAKANSLTWDEVLTTGANKVTSKPKSKLFYARREGRNDSIMSQALHTIRKTDEFAVVFDWLSQRGAQLPHTEVENLIQQAENTARNSQSPEAMLWVLDKYGVEAFNPYLRQKAIGVLLETGAAPVKALGELLAAIAPENKVFTESLMECARTVEQAQVLFDLGVKLDCKAAVRWMEPGRDGQQSNAIPRQSKALMAWALGQGLDVNGVVNPDNGITLLHVAARLGAGALPMADVLLAHGADPHRQDCQGQTPLDFSEHNGFFRRLVETHQGGGTVARKPRGP